LQNEDCLPALIEQLAVGDYPFQSRSSAQQKSYFSGKNSSSHTRTFRAWLLVVQLSFKNTT
jgi:hypothetical protein